MGHCRIEAEKRTFHLCVWRNSFLTLACATPQLWVLSPHQFNALFVVIKWSASAYDRGSCSGFALYFICLLISCSLCSISHSYPRLIACFLDPIWESELGWGFWRSLTVGMTVGSRHKNIKCSIINGLSQTGFSCLGRHRFNFSVLFVSHGDASSQGLAEICFATWVTKPAEGARQSLFVLQSRIIFVGLQTCGGSWSHALCLSVSKTAIIFFGNQQWQRGCLEGRRL